MVSSKEVLQWFTGLFSHLLGSFSRFCGRVLWWFLGSWGVKDCRFTGVWWFLTTDRVLTGSISQWKSLWVFWSKSQIKFVFLGTIGAFVPLNGYKRIVDGWQMLLLLRPWISAESWPKLCRKWPPCSSWLAFSWHPKLNCGKGFVFLGSRFLHGAEMVFEGPANFLFTKTPLWISPMPPAHHRCPAKRLSSSSFQHLLGENPLENVWLNPPRGKRHGCLQHAMKSKQALIPRSPQTISRIPVRTPEPLLYEC